MGAWGAGSFENDDAADWAGRLVATSNLGTVSSALEAATESAGYLDAPRAAEALAAAEVVAALLGHPAATLPDGVAAWVRERRQSETPPPDPRPLAVAATLALDVIENGSELRELWDEAGGADAEAWRRTVYDLRARLSP